MSLSFGTVYKVLPVVIWYKDTVTKDGLSDWAGSTRGPLVQIANKYKSDLGLLEHELVHVKQFYEAWVAGAVVTGVATTFLGLGTFTIGACLASVALNALLYKFVPWYRLKMEARAYKVQVAYGMDPARAADMLLNKYDLDISAKQAQDALK